MIPVFIVVDFVTTQESFPTVPANIDDVEVATANAISKAYEAMELKKKESPPDVPKFLTKK